MCRFDSDSDPQSADHIAGYAGAFARKRALAAAVVRHKLPLTVNCVMHRANIDRIADMVDLALSLGASRIEIAHVQYYGWALARLSRLPAMRLQLIQCVTSPPSTHGSRGSQQREPMFPTITGACEPGSRCR